MTRWHDSHGVVAERTDTVINGLLDWADKQDVHKIRRKNIEDAIKSLTPVAGENAVNQYVERVVTYGPFTGKAGLWEIDWSCVPERGLHTND